MLATNGLTDLLFELTLFWCLCKNLYITRFSKMKTNAEGYNVPSSANSSKGWLKMEIISLMFILCHWCLFALQHDKTNKVIVHPAKTQISLDRPVCSESSLCAQWVAKDPSFLHVDSEDSDQTGRIPRLIWVFAWRILILLVLSCRGSFHILCMISDRKLIKYCIF